MGEGGRCRARRKAPGNRGKARLKVARAHARMADRDGAGEAHVNSDHFRAALETMRPLVQRAPQIVSTVIEGADGWSRMGELGID